MWLFVLFGLEVTATLQRLAGRTLHEIDQTRRRTGLVDPAAAGFDAAALAAVLAAGDPPVIVRDHEVERGFFFLDPCNLHTGEAEIVADRLIACLEAGPPAVAASNRRERMARLLAWPD